MGTCVKNVLIACDSGFLYRVILLLLISGNGCSIGVFSLGRTMLH